MTNMINSARVAEALLLAIFARAVKTGICVVIAIRFIFAAVKRVNNCKDIALYKMVSPFVYPVIQDMTCMNLHVCRTKEFPHMQFRLGFLCYSSSFFRG